MTTTDRTPDNNSLPAPSTEPLRTLLTAAGTPLEARAVPNGRDGWDLAVIVDGGYSHADAEDMAGWWAAQLTRHGVRTVAPERTTT